MKLYMTLATDKFGSAPARMYTELASSSADASKARTRLKKIGLVDVKTIEVEVDNTRAGIISLVNRAAAHPSCRAAETAEKLVA